MAEKQQTKPTNYSSLHFFASLDTQNMLRGGIIVEWEKIVIRLESIFLVPNSNSMTPGTLPLGHSKSPVVWFSELFYGPFGQSNVHALYT